MIAGYGLECSILCPKSASLSEHKHDQAESPAMLLSVDDLLKFLTGWPSRVSARARDTLYW